ncbi:DoxX family protein [Nocardia camponoti]|uniref:DoxX family membrane protein n=1 Tax=Nocardia camponoti TaxID=1616106 RepID=A0A917VFC1_9NOCA|nr:DoxX family protein [Nocardia camponoti]GGK70059.1 hypothetical protein GCM10011591_47740 [Nocardia camponoti]
MTVTTSPATESTTNTETNDATSIGLLILRVGFGGLMAIHGAQKLFGWFNGYGWSANADGFEAMGYHPGALFGTLAGGTELLAGLALALGLFTPLAAAALLGTMVNVLNTTWGNGLMGGTAGPGYEMGLLFAIVAVVIGFTGAGKYSLDNGRVWDRNGVAIGGGVLVVGIVSGLLILVLKAVL